MRANQHQLCMCFKYFEYQAESSATKKKKKGKNGELRQQTPAHMGLVAHTWPKVKFPQH